MTKVPITEAVEKLCTDVVALKAVKAYRYTNLTPGVIENVWNAPDAVVHGNASDIFSEAPRALGFGDEISLPGHVNGAPTIANLEADWTAATGTVSATDQYEYAGFIYIEDDGTQLRDVNGNTGERFRIWVGECCQSPSIVYERTTDTGSGDTGTGGAFVTLNKGWHLLAIQGSDLTVQAGVTLQTSTNGTTWAAFTGETSVTKPKVECFEEPCGYELQDGEFSCVPMCTPAAIAVNPAKQAEATPHIQPQTAVANLESDNNESEGSFIRAGNVGTSDLYAREDHQHPIVRIPNPGDPVIVHTGTGTLVASLILDRESDEESYAYKIRNEVSQIEGIGWDILRVPNIAGFQQPEIYGIGTYRVTSNAAQEDSPQGNGGDGATPRGPYMGKEAHEWSSTRGVYLGIYRRDNAFTMYVEFWVRYTRS